MKNNFNNARRVFGALQGKVTQLEAGKDIVPGIKSIATPGHTPGHTSHIVISGSQSVMVQGDVTNLPALNVRNPEWHFVGRHGSRHGRRHAAARSTISSSPTA